MGLFGNKKKRAGDARGNQVNKLIEERRHLLFFNKNFFVREAYKTLRTNVMFSLTGETDCKVLVVSSSLQSEGKSTSSVNLAISYAEADKKVLLVDCDMRKPKLARLLAMNNTVGLSNVLIDPSVLSEALMKSRLDKLDVLLAGDIPPNPSELLSSSRMQRLLETMKKKYDYIILDTPPVNMVTDAVVLAPHTDGVLMVVRAGRTERGSLINAVSQLEYAHAKILGFILNGVGMESTSYRYSKYRYSSYRRYGYYNYSYSSRSNGSGRSSEEA